MATTLTVNTARAILDWTLESGLTTTSASASGSFSATASPLDEGTGASRARKVYAVVVTITGGSSQSYDLSGSLLDEFGNSVVFSSVKVLFVQHQTSSATGLLDLGGNFMIQGTNSPLSGTTPELHLRPGYSLFLAGSSSGGYTVTNSTQDTLTLTNNDAASISVRLCIIGE